jgi:hypothetical protein
VRASEAGQGEFVVETIRTRGVRWQVSEKVTKKDGFTHVGPKLFTPKRDLLEATDLTDTGAAHFTARGREWTQQISNSGSSSSYISLPVPCGAPFQAQGVMVRQ